MATYPFQWQDPFDLDSQLEEDERMVRDSVAEFCTDALMPGIVEANRHEVFDPELMKQFGGFEGPWNIAPIHPLTNDPFEREFEEEFEYEMYADEFFNDFV